MNEYFRRWRQRLVIKLGRYLIAFPIVLAFIILRDGPDHPHPRMWFALLIGIIFLVLFLQYVRVFNVSWIDGSTLPPSTPAQLRQQRILAVADSVDGLPGGMSLADLCEKLDEKQIRKLLHQLHQIRPGNRHLRDVVKRVPFTP